MLLKNTHATTGTFGKAMPHIFFWVIYLLWQVYVEYIGDSSSNPDLTEFERWRWAIIVEAILLPVKMIASYACVGIISKSLLNSNKPNFTTRPALLILMVLVFTFLLHRVVSNYIAYPIVLGRPVRMGFWEPGFHVSSAIDSLLIIGVFTGLSIFRIQSELSRREVQLQREKLEAELHFLRAQINPHFLFNTLNNIYSLARKKSDLTSEAILKLSKLMRFLLYEVNNDRITIERELGLLQDYIDLEKMRYAQHRLSLKFDTQIDNSDTLIAPLILLNFVENAFKHGASENDGHASIFIYLKVSRNQLDFRIENTNGVIHKAAPGKIGISNAERQLRILYSDYDLKISPEEKKFVVHLNVNLNSYGANQLHNS